MPPKSSWNMRFAVAARAERVDATHPVWNDALPQSSRGEATKSVTYGEYFQAVEAYLHHDGARHLQAALAATPAASSAAFDALDVILEKHGEFYHPARIRIAGPKAPQSLVLNVAVTAAGAECLQSEVEALRRVAPRLPSGALPRVYGVGRSETANGLKCIMFLADWFDNYHEFHLAIDPADDVQKMIVWDTGRTPYFLGTEAATAVYAQTADLLARAYDPASTRQIYPWHHASGDFVVRTGEAAVDVKLITVRQYAPTLSAEAGRILDDESRLMAALVFFANLTIRNRIDRLEGTGALAWAGEAALGATVAGFKRGLDDALLADLTPLLASYDLEDWTALLEAVGTQYRLMPAESALLAPRLEAHAAHLTQIVRQVMRG